MVSFAHPVCRLWPGSVGYWAGSQANSLFPSRVWNRFQPEGETVYTAGLASQSYSTGKQLCYPRVPHPAHLLVDVIMNA